MRSILIIATVIAIALARNENTEARDDTLEPLEPLSPSKTSNSRPVRRVTRRKPEDNPDFPFRPINPPRNLDRKRKETMFRRWWNWFWGANDGANNDNQSHVERPNAQGRRNISPRRPNQRNRRPIDSWDDDLFDDDFDFVDFVDAEPGVMCPVNPPPKETVYVTVYETVTVTLRESNRENTRDLNRDTSNNNNNRQLQRRFNDWLAESNPGPDDDDDDD